MIEIHIRRKGPDQFEVTLVTAHHESIAVATTIGQALLMAADTIQVPVPEGLPRLLDGLRTVTSPVDVRLVWTP